ncbi:hypothetical protein [Acidovorax lacteus]|uniref:Type II secretion system protein GspC N-terminal domain-containing protein n=1 Tax=Acidovorax lacteus TaxID=1924988 RepID=A0ABP8KZV2_9BURK
MKALHWLLAAALGLLGALGVLWLDPQQPGTLRSFAWEPPAPLAPGFAVPQLPVALQGGVPAGTAAYLAVLDRPLFAADRRPPPPPPPPGAKPAEPPPDPLANLTLFGVYTGADFSGIVARFNDKVRRVRVSEAVGEWTVEAVQGRQVTFKRGEESRTVYLAHQYGPRPAPAAGAPATTPVAASAGVPVDRAAIQAQEMEAARERLRQRNELFRKAGLPPVKE